MSGGAVTADASFHVFTLAGFRELVALLLDAQADIGDERVVTPSA